MPFGERSSISGGASGEASWPSDNADEIISLQDIAQATLGASESISAQSTGNTGNTNQEPNSSHSPQYSATMIDEDAPYSVKTLQPWRYYGYPALSAYMASSRDAFLVRRFGTLGVRVTLMLQDRLLSLENQLQQEDRRTLLDPDDTMASSGSFRFDPNPRRKRLLERICREMKQYRKSELPQVTSTSQDSTERFVLDQSTLTALPTASDEQKLNIKNWNKITNNGAIIPEEVILVDQHGDIISIVHVAKTPLRRWADRYIVWKWPWLFGRKPSKHHFTYGKRGTKDAQGVLYFNEDTVDTWVNNITLLLGLAMMLAPLWILQVLSAHHLGLWVRLLVISLFLIAFTLVMSAITTSRAVEILGATAAYGAVLMVYVQLGTPSA